MAETIDRHALQATKIIGTSVRNHSEQRLGQIEDFVLDMKSGRIAYAVMSSSGIEGAERRLFAIPFQSMVLNVEEGCFYLDADEDRLRKAPGFDPDHWPTMGDRRWGSKIRGYWEAKA